MAAECGVEWGVCTIRVTRVDSTGRVIAGNNSYVSNSVISVAQNINKEAGQSFTVRNGCGCGQAQFRQRDQFNWWEFTFVKAKLEPVLTSFLTGAALITDGADTVGVAWPDNDQTDCATEETGVAFEFWTEQIVGSAQASDFPWVHHVYPYTSWSEGNNTHAEAFLEDTIDGFSRTNNLWGDGPYGDGPPDGEWIGNGGWWKTDVPPPDAECNAQPVTSTS